MNIETILIDLLEPDPRNARKHDKRNLDTIAASLREFGQRKPIVVTSNNVVIAGNGTLEAAKQLGWAEITIARAPEDWDENTVRAYALADNQSAALAGWDDEILNETLSDLAVEGWDIEELGFDAIPEPTPVPDFMPTDEVPRLDQRAPQRCPECAFEWHVGPKGEIIPV